MTYSLASVLVVMLDGIVSLLMICIILICFVLRTTQSFSSNFVKSHRNVFDKWKDKVPYNTIQLSKVLVATNDVKVSELGISRASV